MLLVEHLGAGGVNRTRFQQALISVGICLALIILVFVVYGQTRDHQFVNLDDIEYIVKNPHVQEGVSPESIGWAFSSFYAANWHPLTWISHMVDVELFSNDAGSHHLMSAGIHAGSAILLFLVFSLMTGATMTSALLAALFAVHPLRVESVAWASERKDVLSGFLWMATLLFYAYYARKPSAGRLSLVILGFGLGLLAKPMLVTLPFVLLLLDVWPLQRWRMSKEEGEPLSRLLKEKLPLFFLVALSSIITVMAQSRGGAVSSTNSVPLISRGLNALSSYGAYFRQTFWPSDLAVFYPHDALLKNHSWTDLLPTALLFLVVAVLVTTLSVVWLRRFPELFVGWFWFLGTLFPVIGLVQVGSQGMANRYAYLSVIGLTIPVVFLLRRLALGSETGEASRMRCGMMSGMAILLVGATTLAGTLQASTWKSTRSLWMHAVKVTEGNYVAHTALGVDLFKNGEVDAAATHFKKALSFNPHYDKAHVDLGVWLFERGELAEARFHFEAALNENPGNVRARVNLGVAHAKEGALKEAMFSFQRAIEIDPDEAEAHHYLGLLYLSQGRSQEGATHVKRAFALKPNRPDIRRSIEQLDPTLLK